MPASGSERSLRFVPGSTGPGHVRHNLLISAGSHRSLDSNCNHYGYGAFKHEYIGRGDYQITPGERIFARWIGNYQSTVAPIGQLGLPCDGEIHLNTQDGWNLAVDLTSTLSPSLVNELSVGPSAYRSSTTANNGNITVGANNIDLPLLFPVSSTTSAPDVGYSGNGQSYAWSYFGATPWFQPQLQEVTAD